MSILDLEKAIALINENSSYATFCERKEEEIIEKAEQKLSLKFPPSFRKFLQELGAGDIFGVEFYGVISDPDKDAPLVPNGIWLTLKYRHQHKMPVAYIIVAETGDGGFYVIDTSRKNNEAESPVVIWEPRSGQVAEISEDFGAFVYQQISDAKEGW